MYLMGSDRCDISAKQIQRETGVTYKTAWRMFNQIYKLMAEDLKLGGPESSGVEVDEMYHGGHRKGQSGRILNAYKGGHSLVLGIVERRGRIKARGTPDLKKRLRELDFPVLLELATEMASRKPASEVRKTETL